MSNKLIKIFDGGQQLDRAFLNDTDGKGVTLNEPSDVPLSSPGIGSGSGAPVGNMMTAARQERVEGVEVSHRRRWGSHRYTSSHRYVDGGTHGNLNRGDYER